MRAHFQIGEKELEVGDVRIRREKERERLLAIKSFCLQILLEYPNWNNNKIALRV